MDKKKAVHYLELGALRGDPDARHKLGVVEGRVGNYDRALKHLMIAVKGGNSDSLEGIKILYETRFATKDEYTKSLHSYQAYQGEIKSDQRDEAASDSDQYKYY